MKWQNVHTMAIADNPDQPGTWMPVLAGTYWDEMYTDEQGRVVLTHGADGEIMLGEGQTWESALRFVLASQRQRQDAYNRRRDETDAAYLRHRSE